MNEMDGGRRAVCLLSGGLDSATCLAIARSQHRECYCLSFDYGQRHQQELAAAQRVAAALGAREHKIAHIDLRLFGHSALTSDLEVPKDRNQETMSAEIPVTYVPARNTIFLAFALAYAEVTGSTEIFIGVNAVDYSGYPDCRPEFVEAFSRLANLATRAGVEGTSVLSIQAPLMKMSKAQIILTATRLGVDLSLTHSCYDPLPEDKACGRCDACVLRREGFAEAGLRDPALVLQAAAVPSPS